MKLIIIGLVGAVVLIGGFFALNAYIYEEKQADDTVNYPAPAAGKIDPRVACESALMYTTFTSGEEAEAFVEACVAGEHPEVIERYIESLNVDGAVI
jgi:hypothetical protein